ncbi:MAG: methyltransferase domain-containing protein [bacterium]|nr:methyltransferase domain-containing protein [bacterium]
MLDLGCAGGRNAAYLTELDVAVLAIDAEPAMVAATRARLAARIGPEEATRRVRLGHFDRLTDLGAAEVDLVLALGVLQNAANDDEFARGVAEIARVLRAGGEALVAHFAPSTRPPDRELRRAAGSRHGYTGFYGDDHARPMVLHEAPELDAAFLAVGLAPTRPSDTVVAPSGVPGSHRTGGPGGTRVTVNGHDRRLP